MIGGPATSAPRGLLAIFAHPDDETLGAGGTMALAAAAGVPTWIVCATDGDLGGEEGSRELDPELRRGELRCAMAALGVREPIFLGYGDSGMEGWAKPAGCLSLADEEEVVERLAEIILALRPATVVTFDPGGIYGHPDHVTISARAREPTADDLLQRRRFVELARPDEDFTTHVDVRPVLDRKLAALVCHASQLREDWSAAPRDLLETWLGRESFIRVEPSPLPGERETALRGVV